MKLRLLVGGAVISDGKILLLKRVPTKKLFPGHWEMPGGKVEPGEDPNVSVIREIKEETGLDADIITPYSVWAQDFEYDGETENLVQIDFLTKVAKSSGIKLSGHEHSDHKWVAPTDKLPEPMTEMMKTAVGKALKMVKEGKR